jgi:hypothetical protein
VFGNVNAAIPPPFTLRVPSRHVPPVCHIERGQRAIRALVAAVHAGGCRAGHLRGDGDAEVRRERKITRFAIVTIVLAGAMVARGSADRRPEAALRQGHPATSMKPLRDRGPMRFFKAGDIVPALPS